jgi:cytochrome c biogenesis protein
VITAAGLARGDDVGLVTELDRVLAAVLGDGSDGAHERATGTSTGPVADGRPGGP